jgi:ABC-2 type transport system permease protein
MNAIAAERIKLLSSRSIWWCAALSVLLVAGPVGLIAALSTDGWQPDGTEFLTLGQVVVLVLAALTVTGEYRHGTIRVTFLAVPNRTTALLAKTVVVALASGVVGLVAGLAGRGTAWLMQPDAGLAELGWMFGHGAPWRAVAGSAAVFALSAVLAVAVAILLRSTAGSVSLLLGWVLVVEPVVASLPQVGDDIGRWLPFANADHFLYAGLPEPGSIFDAGMPFGPWGALVYFAAIAAALLAAALWVANRRDA